MLFRRLYQFMIVYGVFLGLLLSVKTGLSLSDYVIPGIPLILDTACQVVGGFSGMCWIHCLWLFWDKVSPFSWRFLWVSWAVVPPGPGP